MQTPKMVGFFQKSLQWVLYLILLSCGKKNSSVSYKSENLNIIPLTEKVLIHTSYLTTDDFGKVGCNGAIFINQGEAVILDTPTNDDASRELIDWVKNRLNCVIIGVIPTHFHDDCIGGIEPFYENKIETYASVKTIEFAKLDGIEFHGNSFDNSIDIKVGKEKIITSFFGAGHTLDNVVVYYPTEKALFGGCLVKSLGANKGYLGDADTTEWSNTIRNILSKHDDIEIVIPGHGKSGNAELLDYTITLFDQNR